MAEETILIRIKANVKEAVAALTMSQKRFRELETQTEGFNKRMRGARKTMGRMVLTTRRALLGMRGFKMEMLSVMFFGLGMKKFFTGMIRPALEMVGVFEVFRLGYNYRA